MWRGHDHDLAVVGRIGQRFLVAGHAGGEDDLAEGLPHRPEGLTDETAPVLKHQAYRVGPGPGAPVLERRRSRRIAHAAGKTRLVPVHRAGGSPRRPAPHVIRRALAPAPAHAHQMSFFIFRTTSPSGDVRGSTWAALAEYPEPSLPAPAGPGREPGG